jgi:hypothetical protein
MFTGERTRSDAVARDDSLRRPFPTSRPPATTDRHPYVRYDGSSTMTTPDIEAVPPLKALARRDSGSGNFRYRLFQKKQDPTQGDAYVR